MILNWGGKVKKICEASIRNCENCKHATGFYIVKIEKTAGMFFIPVVKWDKKLYLMCSVCEAGIPIDEESEEKAIRMYTELPNHKLSQEIYNKIDNVASEFLKNNKNMDDLIKHVLELSKDWGYKAEPDFKYIFSVFLNNLLPQENQ